MKNYWKLDGVSLFTIPYVYVDHNSYFADSLFEQRKKAKMLLLGHNDYVDVCDEIAMLLDKKVKERKR